MSQAKMSTGSPEEIVDRRLAEFGLRLTEKRKKIYQILISRADHPSAEEIFIQAKKEIPEISLATVYNCLETLARSGLIKEVVHERGATRYCTNLHNHHHFYCDRCGKVFDVQATDQLCHMCVKIPDGFEVRRFDVVLHGLCRNCAQETKDNNTI